MKPKLNLVSDIICILLILLFVYTGTSKFLEFENFKHVLSKSPLLDNLSLPVAIFIPGIELIISFLLLIPPTKTLGLYSSAILIILFSIYITYMILFAKHLPCGCGGVFKLMTWNQHLIFNIFLIILSVLGIYLRYPNRRKLIFT